MQAASVAAMAAQSVLVASPSSLPLLSSISNPNLTHSQSLNSSFHGVSLKFPRQSLALSLSAAAPKRPLAAVAATEKTVAVLKGTSTVEGVVTLTQDDDGLAEATMVDSEILLSDPCVEPDDELGPVAAVPKKRTSRSKKRIRKNVWKRKGYVAALKAYSLAKSILTGKSTSFMTENLKKDT